MKPQATLHSIRVAFYIAAIFPAPVAALEWTEGTGYRSAPVTPIGSGRPGFTLLDPTLTGLAFTNSLTGDMFLTNAVAHNGSGLAVGDVDGDDLPDIYICNLQGPNGFFRNKGNWTFEPMDPGPAACADQLSTGAAFADVDGDRDLDLLVNGIAAGTRLFLNDGTGRWTEPPSSGLSRTNSATSMALADIDRDGDLDLYVTHYIDVMHLADPTTKFTLARLNGKWEVTRVNGQSTRNGRFKDRFEALADGSVRELPETHALYRNDGKGHFTAIQNEPGTFQDSTGKPIAPFRDWGLAVMFRDINRDGAPDFYVCNDNASPDRFWINNGDGTFRAAAPFTLRHTSRSSMGLDFADINRDGHDDFIVVDMLARDHAKRLTQLVRDLPDPATRERIDEQPRFNRNTLFLGRPDGSFAGAAYMAGVAASDWSWCPIFLDVDLDGYEDLLVSNGFSFDVMDQDTQDDLRRRKLSPDQQKRIRQFNPQWPTKIAAFRNKQDGNFSPVTDWGFNHDSISYGMALGDLDNDGDMDVLVNRLNESVAIYRNDSPAPRIAIRLHAEGPNTFGVGARVRLLGSSLTQVQEIIAGGRYMSGDQAVRTFAATGKGPFHLEVQWPGKLTSVIQNATPNQVFELRESGDTAAVENAKAAPPALFEDVSTLLGHNHVENYYDDWARQPSLPRRLSRLGPGLVWSDVNGDRWDDLVIGVAQGGNLAINLNQSGKRFVKGFPAAASPGDQLGIVKWTEANQLPKLIISQPTEAHPAGGSLAIHSIENGSLNVITIAVTNVAPGPLATADVDGDGDLDLFVGGRYIPGRYPEPADSSLWLNIGEELKRSSSHDAIFAKLGLVTGAAFSDLDGDADPDLALSLEWGPIRIFENQNGVFSDATAQWGTAPFRGWWTGIVAADFNGDGKLDLAAGNWGLNSPQALHSLAPIRLYYSDRNRDGILELFEGVAAENQWVPYRDKKWLARAIPDLDQRFPTHKTFAGATVAQVIGAETEAKFVEASHFEASVFLNRGGHFERIPLPREAQLAPVLAMNVGDFDNDGNEDLFAGQNDWSAASEMSREDSGQGLVLTGRGDGTFRPLDSLSSGIRINGEQRGAALADFDRDGRVDLAVSQNNAGTKLYANRGDRRGLRVSLHGSSSNPLAIGAQMRIVYTEGHSGPVRIVDGGSGYLSQNSDVQVLGLRPNSSPQSLWVRWPEGVTQSVAITNQMEMEVTFPQ